MAEDLPSGAPDQTPAAGLSGLLRDLAAAPGAEAPQLAPGTELAGRYRIERELGAGGMGRVYAAWDSRLSRRVAVKVLGNGRRHPEALARFEQEARAAGALNHPNVLAVHDVGVAESGPWLVTELLEGRTLRALLAKGPLPLRRALELAVQLAEGLAEAHGKGVVHRDLKPENLFVTGEGRLKILDFGLARLTGEVEGTAPTTRTGAVLGTVPYMSPEQVRGEHVDARSDLFSLGAVLHELLTGRILFSRATSLATGAAILDEEPPPLPAGTPPAVEALVRRCLQKEPARRFQSARDLGFALEAELAAAGGTGPGRTRAAGWSRRRAALAAGTALALGLAAGLAAGLRLRRPDAAEPPRWTRLSTAPDFVSFARFSADGLSALYTGARGTARGPTQLYATRLDRPFSQPQGVEDALLAGVSPSGELALLLGGFVGRLSIFRAPGTLALQVPGNAPVEKLADVYNAGFLRDGALWVVRKEGDRFRLESPPGTFVHSSATVLANVAASPDGRLFAFADHPVEGDNTGWVAVVDRAGAVRRLSRQFPAIDGVAFSPSGHEIWFGALVPAGAGREDRALVAVGLDGAERRLLSGTDQLTLFDVDARGRALVSLSAWEDRVRCRGPAGAAESDCTALFHSYFPKLSADGSRLLLHDDTDTATGVYLRSTDGGLPARLADGGALALSPDGRWALVLATPGADATVRLSLQPTGPGAARPVDLGDRVLAHRLFGAAFAPDSRRFAVTLRRPDGQFELAAGKVEGGPLEPLCTTGERLLAFFANEREVVLRDNSTDTRPSPGGLWLQPLDGRPPRELPPGLPGGLPAGTTARPLGPAPGGLFWYLRHPSGDVAVHRLDLSTGRSEPARTFPPWGGTPVAAVALSADGRAWAYQVQTVRSTLHLVEGLR